MQHSRSFPACTWVSDRFAAIYSAGPDLGDNPSALSALAPSPSPTLAHSQRPFARTVCYHHRHCSYGLLRQCRAHQRTSRGNRLYRRPYGHDTFPALITHPCPGAATHTPGDHLSACTHLLPQVLWPSPALQRLGISGPTVVLSTPSQELLVVGYFGVAVFA